MSALTDYPAAKRILEAQGRARMEHTREVKNGLAGDSASDTDSPGTGSPRPASSRDQFMRVLHKEGLQRSASIAGVTRQSVADVMEGLRECTAEYEKSIEHMKTAFQEVVNGQVATLSKKVWTLERRLARKESLLRSARRAVVSLERQLAADRGRGPGGQHASHVDVAQSAAESGSEQTSVPAFQGVQSTWVQSQAKQSEASPADDVKFQVHCAHSSKPPERDIAPVSEREPSEDKPPSASVHHATKTAETERNAGSPTQISTNTAAGSGKSQTTAPSPVKSSDLEKKVGERDGTLAVTTRRRELEQEEQGKTQGQQPRRHFHSNSRMSIRRQGAAIADSAQWSGRAGWTEQADPAALPSKAKASAAGGPDVEKTTSPNLVDQVDLCRRPLPGKASAPAAPVPDPGHRPGTVFEVRLDQSTIAESGTVVHSTQNTL